MILALEFSSPRRSVALLGGPDSCPDLLAAASDRGSRSIGPLKLVRDLLAQAKVPPAAIRTVVIGLGPGSYTGIRSAIALAQGWQLARDVQLLGISTVECLAHQAQAEACFGRVGITIDAQRGEVYLAEYDLTPSKRQVLVPLHLTTAPTLFARVEQAQLRLVGPEATRWAANGRVLLPAAETLGRLALELAPKPVPGEKLEPIYLRETTFVKATTPKRPGSTQTP